jgi:uncharacterized membrane protein
MAEAVVLALFSFGFPSLWLFLQRHSSLLKKINPLIACYAAGLLVGNIGIMGPVVRDAVDQAAGVVALVVIPLMLFSVDLVQGVRLAKKALLSLLFAFIAVMVSSFTAHLVLQGRIPDSANLAGMAIGVYTGGTPNLVAIKTALGVGMDDYLAIHTADMLVSSLYLLFVLTIGKRVLGLILPPFSGDRNPVSERVGSDEVWKPSRKILDIGISLVLSLLIAGAGISLFLIAPPAAAMMLAVLTVTTLALAASFLPVVRRLRYSFRIGEYLVCVFCVAAGSLGNVLRLISASPWMVLFVGIILFGSFLIHVMLSALARIDTDTTLAVSASCIFSPPFIGAVSMALDNRAILVTGITTGLIGYAAGNYLGILFSRLLAAIVP